MTGSSRRRNLITADWPVALDSDVDLWLVGPDKKPVFYGAREAGCASLDRDSLGYSTSQITLADGSQAQSESNKETATIRCIAPGHYDIGVNLYSDRELAKGAKAIPVRVEITGLNPQVTTLFAGNVALDQVGQTINVVSFELSPDGQITLVEPPLEPITDAYKRDKPRPGDTPSRDRRRQFAALRASVRQPSVTSPSFGRADRLVHALAPSVIKLTV